MNIRFVPDKALRLVNGTNATTRSLANVSFALEKPEDKEGGSSSGGSGEGGGGNLDENPLG